MAFTRRHLSLTFILGKGTFGASGSNTVEVSGLRVRANISNVVGPGMSQAFVRVYGLPLDLMNQLSINIPQFNGRFETSLADLIIKASDDETAPSVIFQGQITLAPINMNSQPESFLEVVANPGALQAVQVSDALSYPDYADAAVILKTLADRGNLAFENDSNISVKLFHPYFPGSVRDQIKSCAQAANINWAIDNNALIIWPKGGARGSGVQIISADTGMIGYPSNWSIGVEVSTLFNPSLKLGTRVQLESDLTFANGFFGLVDVNHALESETPDGMWETQFHGVPLS